MTAVLLTASVAHAQHRSPGTEAVTEDEDERLRGADLQRDLPGVETALRLPALRVIPALNMLFPYQWLGLGVTLEAVPWPWLHGSLRYAFGFTIAQSALAPSNYAEGLLGVRLLGIEGESAVDIPLRGPKPIWDNNRPAPVVKAWIPAYHALFLEGGAMTGFISLEHCRGACVDATGALLRQDQRQLIMPLGGLRYAYAYEVTAKRRNVRSRFLLEAYAHLLFPPLNPPRSARYLPNGDFAGDPGFGVRGGLELPPFGCLAEMVFGSGCLGAELSIGYAPYPRVILLQTQVGYPFY